MATFLTAATVAVGVIIALRGFRGSLPAIILGGILVAAGLLAYARALRPWQLNERGLSLAGNQRLAWTDVTRIQVLAVTPKGAGRGMPRVDLVISTPQCTAQLTLISRNDAEKVCALLEQVLPPTVEGRQNLWLIDDAWRHLS
jgi:hypothetical protein